MSEPRNRKPVGFARLDSFLLANFFIRTVWKTAAGLIAAVVRLFTTIALAIIRICHRNRRTW